jgi:large subunit ribosomal protein L18
MTNKEKLKKRHRAIRSRIFGTAERPRLQVFRSHKHIYAQLINDDEGKTIATESDIKEEVKTAKDKKTKTERAFLVGEKIAKTAKEKKIKKVVFDRKGYLYHGRVKAVAQGARKGGLEF